MLQYICIMLQAYTVINIIDVSVNFSIITGNKNILQYPIQYNPHGPELTHLM